MNTQYLHRLRALVIVLSLYLAFGGTVQAFAGVFSVHDGHATQTIPDGHPIEMQHDCHQMNHQDGSSVDTATSHDCDSCVAHCATAYLRVFEQPALFLDIRGRLVCSALEKPALADITVPFRPPRS